MKEFMYHLEAGARAMGWPLSQAQVDQMAVHGRELLAWNEVANLTAIKNPVDLAERQFLDVLPLIEEIPYGSRLLDLGSGGGFPGLPLKVIRPDIHILLIDGRRKRVSFLKHVIRILGLENADARQVRAETLSEQLDDVGGPFEVVVSKAVGSIGLFVEIGLGIMARDGKLIAMKGKSVDQEMALGMEAVSMRGFRAKKKPYRLAFSNVERCLVIIERIAPAGDHKSR